MIKTESNKEYHSNREYISKSRLAKMAVCPEYFKWCEENPEEPTEALTVGSAFHKIVLEPHDFDSEFVVSPLFDRRTKQGKADYEEFVAQSNGRQIITQEQYEMICQMRDVIMRNKYCKALLKGRAEQSIYFEDELTGEKCKCRPDTYRQIRDRIVIVDLKSCTNADTDSFMRDVNKYAYDLQSYMYRYGVSKEFNMPIEKVDFVFIAIEKKAPYLMNILQADDYVGQRGEQLFREYIGMYHECKESGNWYGYNGFSGEINNLSLPKYLIKETE